MARIQEIKNKHGITYRVQKMTNGVRVGKTFSTRAEAFLGIVDCGKSNPKARLCKDAINEFIGKSTHKDWSGILVHGKFWTEKLEGIYMHQVSHKLVDDILDAMMDERVVKKATCDRYRSFLSNVYELTGFNDINPARGTTFKRSVYNPAIYSLHEAQVISMWCK